MPGNLLTTASQIQCLHRGQAILLTKNMKTLAASAVLLETDVHTVVACPFTVGLKYSPCVRIEWSNGDSKVSVDSAAVLVESSVGKCINAEGATQGVATIVTSQMKAKTL